MRTNSAELCLVAICLAGWLAACDRTPTGPDGNRFLRSLEIVGPQEVAPGATVRFTLTAHYSDGSIRDVSSESTWRSSNAAVVSVSSGGLATGHQLGEANVTGVFGTAEMSRETIVVPAGTFRLTGTVTDNPLPGVPRSRMDGALVESTTENGATLSTVTDASGGYRLYGVPPSAQLRVTKSGYEPRVQSLALSHHQTIDVALTLASVDPDLSGTYALTISASASCRANLPEEARTRTYVAAAAQRGAMVRVRLDGASFLSSHSQVHNFFDGEVGQMPAFTLYEQADGTPFPGVAEELTPTLIFVPTGRVVTRLSTSGLSGALEGEISVRERTGDSLKTIASCSAADHQFVLAR
jgi:hypothetical protein